MLFALEKTKRVGQKVWAADSIGFNLWYLGLAANRNGHGHFSS